MVGRSTHYLVKIALVTAFDLDYPGGVAEHVLHLGSEFRRLGHEVAVLAPRSRNASRMESDQDGVYEIGNTITLPTNGSRARVTLDVTRYPAVRRLLRRERFDIVHVHAPLTPALTWMALFGSDAVNVATFHAQRDSSNWYRAFAPVFAPVVNRLDARIAVSEPARRFCSRYFPGTYTLIPNGIDLVRFGPDAEPFPWAMDGRPRILFVGRHDEPRKGLDVLLRAMPEIRSLVPGARLIVAGDGDVRRHAMTLEAVGSDGVTFAGLVAPDDLPRYYASCDVFCAPSTGHESFGIVLLEAMASGKPIVASDIPGYASVMTHQQEGLLLTPRDSGQIANATANLLTHPRQRAAFGAAGRATAEGYAWPRIAAQVLQVYDVARSSATTTACAR